MTLLATCLHKPDGTPFTEDEMKSVEIDGVVHPLLTPRELAMRLQITQQQLNTAVEREEIPVVYIADETRFILEDVVARLQKKSFESWLCRDAFTTDCSADEV